MLLQITATRRNESIAMDTLRLDSESAPPAEFIADFLRRVSSVCPPEQLEITIRYLKERQRAHR